MDKVLFSSNNDDWKTPTVLYDFLIMKGFVDLFPYMCEFNQLDIDYNIYKNKYVFINPPYSKLRDIRYLEYIKNVQIVSAVCVVLVPSRTDTWWFEYLSLDTNLYFFKGRLHFNDSKGVVPFPSVALLSTKRIDNNYNFDSYSIGSIEDFKSIISYLTME